MTRMVIPAACALALAGALPAQTIAPPVTPPAAPAAQPGPAALRLARAYLPVEKTIELARASFRHEFARSFDATPQSVALERRFPGVRAAAQAAGEQALANIYRARMPAVQQRVAAFAAANFSEAESNAVSAFIESPAGRRLLDAQTADSTLPRKVAEQMRTTGKAVVTQADLATAVDPQTIATMPEAQLRATIAFMATPAAVKFNARGAELAQLVADETTAMVKAEQPRITQAIQAGVAAHVNGGK